MRGGIKTLFDSEAQGLYIEGSAREGTYKPGTNIGVYELAVGTRSEASNERLRKRRFIYPWVVWHKE